jgi:hypothetical protein
MRNDVSKLTLYQPATYQIKVPGALDALWVDDASSLCLTVKENVDEKPITILTGPMDQSALQGLLRRLYGLGLPLISVIWIGFVERSIPNEG